MTDTILEIDSIDVTPYIVMDNLKVDEEAYYDESSFVNVYGEERRQMIGTACTISVDLIGVPESIAESILGACDSETTEITYNAPLTRTADFPRPKTSATLSYEESAQRCYDIHIDASVKIPLSGL